MTQLHYRKNIPYGKYNLWEKFTKFLCDMKTSTEVLKSVHRDKTIAKINFFLYGAGEEHNKKQNEADV